jgi:hypothetical protein
MSRDCSVLQVIGNTSLVRLHRTVIMFTLGVRMDGNAMALPHGALVTGKRCRLRNCPRAMGSFMAEDTRSV